jgi:hypothetical protein
MVALFLLAGIKEWRFDVMSEMFARAFRPRHVSALCVAVSLMSAALPGRATELWMSVLEPQWRQVRGWPANDFQDIFAQNASWKVTATLVTVMNFSLRFILTSPDNQLQAALAGLKSRQIQLAIQAQPLTATKACGLGTESFGPPNEMAEAASRLKHFGADLRYVLMDEPLYFGHQFPGSPGKIPCHFAIYQLADQAARKMTPILKAYPNVLIDDVEPFGGGALRGEQWAETILDWHRQFKLKSGVQIRFFDADIIWQSPGSVDQFLRALPLLKRTGLSTGVIYHGSASATSNQEWCLQAFGEIQAFEVARGANPDRVSVESWNDFPRRLLPETEDGTLTNLILKYVENRRNRGLTITRTSVR